MLECHKSFFVCWMARDCWMPACIYSAYDDDPAAPWFNVHSYTRIQLTFELHISIFKSTICRHIQNEKSSLASYKHYLQCTATHLFVTKNNHTDTDILGWMYTNFCFLYIIGHYCCGRIVKFVIQWLRQTAVLIQVCLLVTPLFCTSPDNSRREPIRVNQFGFLFDIHTGYD